MLLPLTSGHPGKAEEAGAEEEDGPRFRDRGADSGQDHVALVEMVVDDLAVFVVLGEVAAEPEGQFGEGVGGIARPLLSRSAQQGH
jgi:hypothetical protein